MRAENMPQDFKKYNRASIAQRERFQKIEERQKISKALKGTIAWNKGLTKETDIRVRENIGFSGHFHTKESKDKVSEKLKGHLPSFGFLGHKHTQEWKEEAKKRALGNPANKGRTKENDEGMRRHAESMLGNHFSRGSHWPEKRKEKYREMFSGEKNPAYIDGRSFIPYSSEFNETLKEQIRKRDNYQCQLCGVPGEECERNLDIHHIDENKKNNLPENLISLCLICHLTTRSDREFWKMFFQSYINTQVTQKKVKKK